MIHIVSYQDQGNSHLPLNYIIHPPCIHPAPSLKLVKKTYRCVALFPSLWRTRPHVEDTPTWLFSLPPASLAASCPVICQWLWMPLSCFRKSYVLIIASFPAFPTSLFDAQLLYEVNSEVLYKQQSAATRREWASLLLLNQSLSLAVSTARNFKFQKAAAVLATTVCSPQQNGAHTIWQNEASYLSFF